MPADEQSPLQKTIREAIEASDRTRDSFDSELRKLLGTSSKPLWDVERGKVKKPSPRILRAMEQVLGFDEDRLVDLVHPRAGSGGKVVAAGHGSTMPEQPVAHSVDAGEVVEITRLDLSLPMGPGATVDDYIEQEPLAFDASYIRSFTRTPPYRLRLAAGAGDSMFPTLVPNDLVWIDTTQNQLLHADRIYAASINGGAAIKRLRPVAGGARILVISDNKMIEPYEVEASEVVIWGRVIRFARDL